MNPPSTPTSPFISAIRTHDDANISSGTSRVFSSGMNGRAFGKHTGSVSPRHLIPRPDWVSGEPARNSDENGYLAPETKRRRCSFFPVRRDLSPVCGYAPHQPPFAIERPSMQSKVPCGIDPFQSSRIGNPGRPDPSLVLPPLQTPSQTQGINMIMAVPFLNKIKELAEISPPFTTTDSALASQGLVIAVEGQNPGSVQCVLRHLENVFASRPGNDVRVFHGPELHSSRPSTAKDPRDTTMQHLKTMSTWHRISKDILNFVSNSSEHPATDQGFSTELTSKPSAPHTAPTISTVADSTFRVALVPQYQLSTADAHACATPINDAYAPIDHWRWTATPLWRGCVGPDITIYVRDCDKEELSRFGEGNPVENRLGDARTLIVRRAVGSPDSIEEKALRRMGFEVVEFLGR